MLEIVTPNLQYWRSPAKLNLFLHIIGRRADGYHLLQTVFQLLEHGDLLTFSVREDQQIQRVGTLSGIEPDRDLTVLAAHLIKKHTRSTLGVDIQIQKQIPIGGGLGGGSSNAATTLVALNSLWNLHLPIGTLANLGLQLGADVPLFVHGRSAWGEGVGEKLTPMTIPEAWYLIIDPHLHVRTKDVFLDSELTRGLHPIKMSDFFKGKGKNVCEPVVRRIYKEIDELFNWLTKYVPAKLTGTGGCVFASFTRKADAQKIAHQVPEKWGAIVTKGINYSPLFRQNN